MSFSTSQDAKRRVRRFVLILFVVINTLMILCWGVETTSAHNRYLDESCRSHAVRWLSYNPGPTNTGDPIDPSRTNPDNALGEPENDDSLAEFVSLGFGGELVLEVEAFPEESYPVALYVSEISRGSPACGRYPEWVEAYVSEDGIDWMSVGSSCQDDGIFPLEHVVSMRYVRLVDVSNPNDFGSSTADGYDVDGITVYCQAIPTPTVAPTDTLTPTVTPTDTSTPTVTPTDTLGPVEPTDTSTPTVTPTDTLGPVEPTDTLTPTVTPTDTSTPTVTPTDTLGPVELADISTPTSISTLTATPLDIPTSIVTPTDTLTPTTMPTDTPTPTATPTTMPTDTPASTAMPTATPTPEQRELNRRPRVGLFDRLRKLIDRLNQFVAGLSPGEAMIVGEILLAWIERLFIGYVILKLVGRSLTRLVLSILIRTNPKRYGVVYEWNERRKKDAITLGLQRSKGWAQRKVDRLREDLERANQQALICRREHSTNFRRIVELRLKQFSNVNLTTQEEADLARLESENPILERKLRRCSIKQERIESRLEQLEKILGE